MIDDEATRAEEIYRRWRRTTLDVMGRSSWAGWTMDDAAFVVSLTSAVLLLLLEPALWLQGWPPRFFGDRGLGWLTPSLLAVPLHGWLLDRFLSAKTPVEQTMPRWLLALRFAAASLPLFSFALLPAWRMLLEQRPRWAFPDHRPRPSLGLSHPPPRSRSPGRLLHVYTSGAFALWMALGFALPIFWTLWLAHRARAPVVVAVCALLHLVTFAGARIFVARLRQTRSGRLPGLLPWLNLLPVPGPIAGTLMLVALEKEGGTTESLTWSAWARRSTVGRLPLWLQLQDALRSQWRTAPWFQQWRRPRLVDRRVQAGELDRALLSFYRRKTLLLLLESGGMVAGLANLVHHFPRLGPTVSAALHFATFFGIALAGIGLILWLGAAVLRLLRIPSLSGSGLGIFGRYLWLTPLAFLAGSQGGFLWIEGRQVELGLLIGLGGSGLAMLTWLFFVPTAAKAHGLGTGALWSFLFLALALTGIPIGLDDRFCGWPGHILKAVALQTPLWSLLLFRRFGPWLARPFLWRDLSDLQLSSRVRTALVLLKWTAILPGGGLAIPAWIALQSFLDTEFRQARSAREREL